MEFSLQHKLLARGYASLCIRISSLNKGCPPTVQSRFRSDSKCYNLLRSTKLADLRCRLRYQNVQVQARLIEKDSLIISQRTI